MVKKIITQGMVLDALIDKMMAAKGQNDEDEREVLRQQLEERVEKAMINALSDAQLIELDGMLDNGASDDEVEAFFDNTGVDYSVAIERAMNEFRDEYMNHANNMNNMGGQN